MFKGAKLSCLTVSVITFSQWAMAAPAQSKGQTAMPMQAVTEPSASTLKLKPITGITYMGLSGPDSGGKVEGTDQKTRYRPDGGHTVGVGIIFPMSRFTSFETGLQYVRSNSKSNTITDSESGTNSSSTFKYRSEVELEHLAVPLLANYCFSGCNEWSFFARGGVIPTYFLGGRARVVYSSSYTYNGTTYSSPEKSQSGRLNDADFTGVNALGLIGGGYQFQFNRTLGLVLDTNFVHGLFRLGGSSDAHAFQQGLWAGAHLTVAL